MADRLNLSSTTVKRALFSLICTALVLFATGCETEVSDGPLWTAEKPLPGGAPGFWRIDSTHQGDGYFDQIRIRNTSSGKLHIVGLVTRLEPVSFVDLHQPGSFNLTLYPGQSTTVSPDGDGDAPPGTARHYTVDVEDWAVD
jgi:hypothetical protein